MNEQDEVQTEIQALGINLMGALASIRGFVILLNILVIVALVHFW